MSSLSYIYFLSSSSWRFYSCSSTCLHVVSSATTFHLSSSSCFYVYSSNLLLSRYSLYLHSASCTICFLFLSTVIATLIMTGFSFILQIHSSPGICTTFLFPFSHIRVVLFPWCYLWSEFLLRRNLWSPYKTHRLVGLGGIITILPSILLRLVECPN